MTSTIDTRRWSGLGLAFVASLGLGLLVASSTYRPVVLGGPGFAQGALIAAIALGLVLTYRGSGVVNLANGTVAMTAAYVYNDLRNNGDLFVPWLSFGPNMAFWPALLLALVVSVVLGLGLHLLVFRHLRGAPPLAKVVASIGVYLLLQGMVLLRYGASTQSVKPMPFVSKDRVDLGITTMTEEQVFVTLFVLAATVALAVVFRRTRFGLATRAAAENERGAVVLGYSPDWLAAVNWVLSTTLTGLLGIFVASINSTVNPFAISALIVPALSAALVGGFASFGLTAAAAFALGILTPVVQVAGLREEWFPTADGQPVPGVDTLIAFLVIVVVLLVRGNTLPSRGDGGQDRLPAAPIPSRTSLALVGPGLIAFTFLATMFLFGPTYRGALSNSLIGFILCLSIVVVTGYVGQISLAPLAFGGVSAFLVAELSTQRGWPFPLPILAGAAVAAAVGLLVAIPALRIRGVNLAIVTLAFAVTAERFLFANPMVNGGLERAFVDTPTLLQPNRTVTYTILGVFTGGDGLRPSPMTSVFLLAVASVLAYGVANFRRSATGRQLLAVRNNERAAAAAGVDVAQIKAVAFALSAAVAGVGGAVIAYRAGEASAGRFTLNLALLTFAVAYLGGISRISGAVLGGLFVTGGLGFTFLIEGLGLPEELLVAAAGLGLVVSPILNPNGVAESLERLVSRVGLRP